jgi:5-methylcytosine-specific restriction endonuclease McrA
VKEKRQTSKLKKEICEICGVDYSLHKHHVIERTEKDTNNKNHNLAILCANCHGLVHSKVIKIIDIFPSTQQPYSRTVVYVKDGVCNVPGIEERYTARKA